MAGAAGRVPVTLLVHDIKHILARPKAQTPEERLDIGLQNFRYWFGSANEFWVGARFYAARALGAHAAFSLHQATECSTAQRSAARRSTAMGNCL